MTGFEQWTCCIGNDRSTNGATTTAPSTYHNCFYITSQRTIKGYYFKGRRPLKSLPKSSLGCYRVTSSALSWLLVISKRIFDGL